MYKIGKKSNQGVNSKRWGTINRETTGDFLIAKKAIKRKKNEKKPIGYKLHSDHSKKD